MKTSKRNGEESLFPTFNSSLNELFDMPFFNSPFFDTSSMWRGRSMSRVPATNICETDAEFIVELAAPGMKKNDFHVDVDNNLLEIKVEKEEKSDVKKTNYTRKEYDYSAFYRSFNLPETIKADKIKAEYENGILRVHLPKVEASKKKPIKEISIS
ncbi:Hsp20/alpha crystallin family protein [Echinicola jeungdonensis]|uniref:Hsp20/alpha crystallin family protein n=1 Tax=Echinicola jeungdonensis TaxID=709343 RepID=A0ABV5J954_9BACT|nr:Hsp20/alpha crystallin family protein [Echinicola jeungdonensis]MDN3670540.1 Hsp20/alpha crystallin family protein [Echinicola jeungdonensis]